MKNKFTIFLATLMPQWGIDIEELSSYVEQFTLLEMEQLPAHLGDIYFIESGTVGKYENKKPKRYILPKQLIFIPLKRHPFTFVALQDTEVHFLDRKKLYEISQKHTDYFILYDLLREQNQQESQYRENILSLDKSLRLEEFRKEYSSIIPLISRAELALYLDISREYLRQIF